MNDRVMLRVNLCMQNIPTNINTVLFIIKPKFALNIMSLLEEVNSD